MATKTRYKNPICSCIICRRVFSEVGLLNHYQACHNDIFNQIREQKEASYYASPRRCKQCNIPIEYKKKKKNTNTFCSHSCAAKYNNAKRPPTRTEEFKKKVSATLLGKIRDIIPKTKVSRCKECGKWFPGRKAHCSQECIHTVRSRKARLNPGLGSKRSKHEIELFNLCNSYFDHVTHNEKLYDGWDMDILIYDINVAILWNGPWHYREMGIGNHSLSQVQQRDKIKTKIYQENGWKVVVFEDRYYTPKEAFDALL